MKYLKYPFCLLCTLLMCFSCTRPPDKPPLPKKICTNFLYEPLSIDPRKRTDPFSSSLHFMLYEGLMRLEPDGSLSFGIAKSVHISKNRLIYTFRLKKSFWSSGAPLTAHDFEASWKSLLSPDFPSPASHLLFPILHAKRAKQGDYELSSIGVHASDDHTLIVELEKPLPYFLELTAFATYFPVPMGGREVQPWKEGKEMVTNGPFQMVSWRDNYEIAVRKNPYFWNAKKVNIEKICIKLISEEKTVLHLFEKGALDWVGGLTSPLPIDSIPSLIKANTLRVHPIAGTNLCSFNTKDPFFGNRHIRRAFAYAINRKLIIQHVTQMFDQVATGPVPPVLKNGCESNFFTDGDSEKAKQELKIGLGELGIEKQQFQPPTYLFFASELQRRIAQVLQSQWKEVLGVEVPLRSMEIKSFLEKLRTKEFAFAQMSWIAQFYDRMSFLERFITKDSSRNYGCWENPQFQELIEKSFFSVSKKEREELLNQAEQVLAEEMPIAPINHYQALYLINPRLRNVEISPLGISDFRYADLQP